mmetsp:Transcript_22786/g.47253  ORF Transcript_22786/g.47253 Transcript_22786/m.47253 type:complete len:140 (+) Transcript_22786:407-826(+)
MSWCIQWDGPLLLATLLQLVSEDTVILLSLVLRPTQIEKWHEVFGRYFAVAVVATDADSELLHEPADEGADAQLAARKADDDEYTLKYFDDSGDEGRAMNVLRLKPLLPLPPESVVLELLRSTSSAQPPAPSQLSDSDY